MICKLVEIALIMCMQSKPGIKTIECSEFGTTTICVDQAEDIACIHDSVDEFTMGTDKFDELGLVRWLNVSCDGFVGYSNDK